MTLGRLTGDIFSKCKRYKPNIMKNNKAAKHVESGKFNAHRPENAIENSKLRIKILYFSDIFGSLLNLGGVIKYS